MGAKFSRSHAKNFIYFDICDAAIISIEYSIENIKITHESFNIAIYRKSVFALPLDK